MTYLEWVDAVLKATVEVSESDVYRGSIAVGIAQVANRIGAPIDNADVQSAMHTAGQDLAEMGLIDYEQWLLRIRPMGIKVVRGGGLKSNWADFFRQTRPLAEDLEVLRYICEASEVDGEHWAELRMIELPDVLAHAGMESNLFMAQSCATRLRDDACIAHPILTIGRCQVRPSYLGVVVATQREVADLEALVRQLVGDWETTSVEVKAILQLDTDRQKAEFCKDLLALANTRVSGRRFMLLGFDDESRQFTTSIDTRVDDQMMEGVLSAYCSPVPDIRYRVADLQEGSCGLIEVLSDSTKLPYRLRRDVWKLKEGCVFVRHNTLVQIAAGEELQRIIDDGRRTRREL